ncbi:MAG TPA: M20/M25/M40 family metallo-hydrolase [Candidatus Acidoferrales bacterium]|nr:M20/M25/M40 family metallo-hydrolase [Candidatus Acidoferrales bacterium]
MNRVLKLLAFSAALLCVVAARAQTPQENSGAKSAVSAVRAYRAAHEPQIIREFNGLLSIPNTASDEPNIQHNAARLVEMLNSRGFRTQLLPIPGRGPVVFAELDAPKTGPSGRRLVEPGGSVTRTVIFYCHYDGQPVDPSKWTGTEPFVPALRTDSIDAGGEIIPFPDAPGSYKDGWRIYARSAGDDKAPIIAILAAVDALRANHLPLAVNLKLVLEGEEEAGSQHLHATIDAHRDLLKGDLLITADGPVDQSGRPLVFFGNRGVISVRLTVYGPLHPLHSGHYGNWAPNPAMRLTQLLATMKDANGRILIPGFYDNVVPLGPAEREAIAQAPDNDATLLKQFGIAAPDGGGKKLLELLNEPSLNIDGLESGWTGAQSKTIIPDSATASLDMRLVKNAGPDQEFERLAAHIRRQGYYVIDRAPTMEERAKYSRIAEVTREPGYPATRTAMDLPVSRALMRVVDEAAGEPAVKIPLIGGSAPMYVFDELGLPVIGVPIVNFDDNQHSPNENVRVGNLWKGMEIYGAILAALRW